MKPGYHPSTIRAKSNQIIAHHYDEDQPGKPLNLLIPGGLLALASLALIVVIAYRTWLDATMAYGVGVSLLAVLIPIYIGSVFLFSYGYELYDVPKALRLTAIIVFITFAAVFILVVLAIVLGALSKDKSGIASLHLPSSSSSGSSSSSTRSLGGGGGLFLNVGVPTPTVTREVVHERVIQPLAPQAIKCPNCGSSYVPAENHFICPNCGAPTPANLLPPIPDVDNDAGS